jgi:hypothetical protein
VAAQLQARRPGQVWECSHVGGDRFAANVLVLPSGLLYGRVRADEAVALADAADVGRVLAHRLRGRVGFPPDIQAAMVHAHQLLPELSLSGVLAIGSTRVAPDLTRVRLAVADQLVDVRVQVDRSSSEWLTCQALAPSSALVHRPVSYEPLVGDRPIADSAREPDNSTT